MLRGLLQVHVISVLLAVQSWVLQDQAQTIVHAAAKSHISSPGTDMNHVMTGCKLPPGTESRGVSVQSRRLLYFHTRHV